jgi:hypothetical protein
MVAARPAPAPSANGGSEHHKGFVEQSAITPVEHPPAMKSSALFLRLNLRPLSAGSS